MSSYTVGQTCKYDVGKAAGGWAVERAGALLGCFAAPEIAIAHACRLAREDARNGWLGIVTTQTSPQEFHCYTPETSQAASRPFPRLVSSR